MIQKRRRKRLIRKGRRIKASKRGLFFFFCFNFQFAILVFDFMIALFAYLCRKNQHTDPPVIPVYMCFPFGDFPEGEIQNYKDE